MKLLLFKWKVYTFLKLANLKRINNLSKKIDRLYKKDKNLFKIQTEIVNNIDKTLKRR